MRRIALIAGLAIVLVAVPALALSPGETIFISQATDGTNANAGAEVDVSSGGRCVVFSSTSPALPGANGDAQIYVRDTEAGTTSLVSVADGGGGGDGTSRFPVVTPDCRYVAFDSESTNLVATPQSQRLVYRRDLQTGVTVMISRDSGVSGTIPNAGAFSATISADGNLVGFVTRATNIGGGPGSLHTDVFLRNVSADTTELISVTSDEVAHNGIQGAGFYTTMSPDGRYVAFSSEAPNLTPDDDSIGVNLSDVFLRDRVAGTTLYVSRATGAGGAPPDGFSSVPQVSADGSRVAFVSDATNLGAPGFFQKVFVRDLVANTTTLVSRADGASGAAANSTSGGQPGMSISPDGTRVLFQSQATNLPDDSSGTGDIDLFVRDLNANTTEMVARSTAGAPASSSQWGVFGPDGEHFAFLTPDGLVPADTDGELDVYMRRLGPSTPTPTPSATASPAPASPAPAAPARPAAVTLRGDAAFTQGTANDLYLACTKLDLYLIDVLPAGRRVAVTGAADLRLAGLTVEILLDGKRVGTAVIGPDGAFAARVNAPTNRKRARARYQARVGTTDSQKLRLARRMVATTLTRSGANLVLRGVVNPPRARRQPAIAVDRFLSCRRRESVKVPSVKPDRSGRFAVRIKVPAGAQAVLYRARTKVPARAGRPATKGTFTLPRAADVD